MGFVAWILLKDIKLIDPSLVEPQEIQGRAQQLTLQSMLPEVEDASSPSEQLSRISSECENIESKDQGDFNEGKENINLNLSRTIYLYPVTPSESGADLGDIYTPNPKRERSPREKELYIKGTDEGIKGKKGRIRFLSQAIQIDEESPDGKIQRKHRRKNRHGKSADSRKSVETEIPLSPITVFQTGEDIGNISPAFSSPTKLIKEKTRILSPNRKKNREKEKGQIKRKKKPKAQSISKNPQIDTDINEKRTSGRSKRKRKHSKVTEEKLLSPKFISSKKIAKDPYAIWSQNIQKTTPKAYSNSYLDGIKNLSYWILIIMLMSGICIN